MLINADIINKELASANNLEFVVLIIESTCKIRPETGKFMNDILEQHAGGNSFQLRCPKRLWYTTIAFE